MKQFQPGDVLVTSSTLYLMGEMYIDGQLGDKWYLLRASVSKLPARSVVLVLAIDRVVGYGSQAALVSCSLGVAWLYLGSSDVIEVGAR